MFRKKPEFKIDLMYGGFHVYRWLNRRWDLRASFATLEDAKAYIEALRPYPIYL